MLTLLLGKDWTANREALLDRIRQDVKEEKGGRILMVPELISHDTERRLCAVAGDTASRFAQVLSFSRLARRVCDLVGSSAVETLDNGGRLVAMASAARQLHSRLKAYAALQTKPEFLKELVDAVDEFKRCCIGPQDLKAASLQAQGSLAQKLEELSLLLEGYDSLCSRGKRDPRDQMTWVLEQLEQIDFAACHVFYIDGFPDFTRQHLAVIGHLIENSPQVTVSLNCDVPGSRQLAFEKAGQTAKELIGLAHRAGVEVKIETVPEAPSALACVRAALFQGRAEYTQTLLPVLKLYKTNSIHQQCRAAAAQIMELVHNGARYRDIALVCTDMTAFRPILKLVFGQASIPMYLAGTEEVLRSGVITTVTAALDGALQGFEQKTVLRYLRSSLSALDVDTCDLVENYAYVWRISGSGWKTEWTNHPQGLTGQWDEASRLLLQRLNAARALAIGPLVRLEAGFKKASNVCQQVMAIYDFLQDIQFAERIDLLARKMDADGDNRSAQILNQLWEILLSALEQLYDVLGETVWDSDVFTKLLKLLLSQYDVGTIPAVLDSVAVGPVTAMRCQQQKYLILLGAEEGCLPGYGGATGLLSDQERVQLRSLGLPLTGGSVEGLQAEFAEIYGVFCGAQESISLYYASSQPSFVFRRMEELVGKAKFTEPDDAQLIADGEAAGAYLARWQDQAAAQSLGVTDSYLDTLFRKAYHLGRMEPDTVRSLYGRTLNLSASQIDRQAECRLSYFLQYGLRAKERKEATVDPSEFGTYVHSVLEQTARQVMAEGGFRQVDLPRTLTLAQEYSDAYIREHFSLLDSRRMEYLFHRNVQELQVVVGELWRELSQAGYTPSEFEMRFGLGGDMPAVEITDGVMPARIRGLVDRVDLWKNADAAFFRVVDYKTGKKGFDYCDIDNGVGLQMLLYLFALEDNAANMGEIRVPAGVQYFPARAPYVRADSNLTEEEAQAQHLKQWKRQGLLLDNEDSIAAMDPSEKLDILSCKRKKDGSIEGDIADRGRLALLKRFIHRLLADMVDDIASGNVQANPYCRGNAHSACTFCPYGSICRGQKDSGKRDYKAMSAQEFWSDLEKREDGYGQ